MTILKSGTGVEDAVDLLSEADTAFAGLTAKLAEVTSALESGGWEGLSYKRCAEMHAMIAEYGSLLAPFCGEMASCCAELAQDIRGFDGNSENIGKARNWR